MSEQLNNPFSKVISLGNETGTITLQLTIGYGQAYSKPIAVNLGGTPIPPSAGDTSFALGSASSIKNKMLAIHVVVQAINPGPPCRASVKYVLVSSTGNTYLDGVTDLSTTVNAVIPFGGMVYFS